MTQLQPAETRQPAWKVFVKVALILVLLFFFLGGMRMMSTGMKELGKNPDYDPAVEGSQEYRPAVYDIFDYAESPLVGLFVGILATSIFQSSSFTTSLAVGFVATTPLQLHQAVFIIMGANIGTSVTNIGVSLGHIRRREEFERAYGSAIVHDVFNLLSVAVLMPVEWIVLRTTGRGILERLANALAGVFYGKATVAKPPNFIKQALKPLVNGTEVLLEDVIGLSHIPASVVLAVLGVAFLFVALVGLTKTLRSLVLHRVEQFFDRVLFRNAATAYLVGLALTAVVQSSSITTSLAVPLVGAGLLTMNQVFPYTLGANLGTTFTALLASLAVTGGNADVGLALAFSHMLFNICGSGIWFPLRAVPMGIARWYARLAAGRKRYALGHLILFFFVLPALVIFFSWLLG